MKTRSIIIIALSAILTTGCGKEHKARNVVENFLDDNLTDNNYSISNVSKIDSTFYLKDSVINTMRNASKEFKTFKQIQYSPLASGSEKLIFIRVTYKLNDKNINQTFYLDKDLKEVMAFKDN